MLKWLVPMPPSFPAAGISRSLIRSKGISCHFLSDVSIPDVSQQSSCFCSWRLLPVRERNFPASSSLRQTPLNGLSWDYNPRRAATFPPNPCRLLLIEISGECGQSRKATPIKRPTMEWPCCISLSVPPPAQIWLSDQILKEKHLCFQLALSAGRN